VHGNDAGYEKIRVSTDFEPTAESLRRHPLPAWFDDAKFGIFVHWGLYSIPAFAQLDKKPDPSAPDMMRDNRYAEWYENTLKFETSETALFHRARYGDAPYSDFQAPFEIAAATSPFACWADIFRDSGARYVTLVTKHHDGYLLWPSHHQNPHRTAWQCPVDIVGEVATAVRAAGMRFGAYYSGGLDWTFNPGRIDNFADMFKSMPFDDIYDRYCFQHYLELIERYRPDYLWNDIGYPTQSSMLALFAAFYNANPDGLVNDRWLSAQDMHSGNEDAQRAQFMTMMGYLKQHRLPPPAHFDVITPEYAPEATSFEKKWEATRGVGASFGYNAQEADADLMTADAIIHLLVDSVSKGGNLLLNVGPRGDGTLCPMQVERLRAVGDWLRVNGEAIYGTRPWVMPAAQTTDGRQVRFTSRGHTVYAIALDDRDAPLMLDHVHALAGYHAEQLSEPQTGPAVIRYYLP
jgi:alpha-L-fucosidase